MSGAVSIVVSQPSLAALACVVALGAILDLGIKVAAQTMLPAAEPVAIFAGLNLSLGYNPGIAFGLFPAQSGLAVMVTVALQLVVMTGLTVLLLRAGDAIVRYCYAAILSGALGNLVDRVSTGAVTDYIDLYLGSWHWPTFNLADVIISLGVAGLIAREVLVVKAASRSEGV